MRERQDCNDHSGRVTFSHCGTYPKGGETMFLKWMSGIWVVVQYPIDTRGGS